MTLVHNGLAIHNNVILHGPTGGAVGASEKGPGPLLLQDHGDKLQYRNVWLVHLPEKGSDKYDPE